MLSHKLLLDDVEEDYQLLAIHGSLEEYKMAYFLNKHLHLNLNRARVDVDFNHGNIQAIYPLFVFKQPSRYRTYSLIQNKYKGPSQKVASSGSLFIEDEVSPQITYLIPEYKEVDYFLKVEDDSEVGKLHKMINRITLIPNVITAYAVDIDQLKSKNNLILE